MKPKVYVETSVISYLASYPSRDLIVAANQQLTHVWWQTCRTEFDLYISQLVTREAGAGDKNAAQQRLALLADLPLLALDEMAFQLAERLIQAGALPTSSKEDALHIAIAATNGIDYLVTWNFKHIANAVMRAKVEYLCREADYEPPTICTPQELLAEE